MKKLAAQLLVFLILAGILAVSLNTKKAKSTSTIVVPDDYPKVQEAIDHAIEGDTVYVRQGEYDEHLFVNKAISLVGEDAEATIIRGQGRVLNAGDASPMLIENLTFLNTQIWSTRTSCVNLYDASVIFRGNIVHGNASAFEYFWGDGGLLATSGDFLIENNLFLQNSGIALTLFRVSWNTTLHGNRFIENGGTLNFMNYHLNLDPSNTVDGKPMYYFDGLNGFSVNSATCPSAGYVCIERSQNFTVENLVLDCRNYEGLKLDDVKDFVIRNVTCGNSHFGISLRGWGTANTTENGSIENCSLHNNDYALRLAFSYNVTLTNNVFDDNQSPISWLEPTTDYSYTVNIDASNSVNGREFYFFKNISGLTVDETNSSNIGCLTILGCTNISISNISVLPRPSVFLISVVSANVTNVCASQLVLWNVSDGNISGNFLIGFGCDICSPNLFGLTIRSSQVTLSENYIEDFFSAVTFISSDIIFKENTIRDCNYVFEQIWSRGKAYHNNIEGYNMLFELVDDYIEWDDGYPSGGNYWSDYHGDDYYSGVYQNVTGSDGVGDTVHIVNVTGASGSLTDHFPLIGPWTRKGQNVSVSSGGVSVTFDNTSEGITRINISASGPDPPSGFMVELGNPLYYDISTSANYSGLIAINIHYNDTGISLEREAAFRLMHWNTNASEWVDITTLVDTANNVIYGQTDSLSPFALMINRKDLTIKNVLCKTIVAKGYSATICLFIGNIGFEELSANVTLYANTIFLTKFEDLNMPVGCSDTLNYTWATGNVDYGNYTFSVSAEFSASGEATDFNNLTSVMPVHLGIAGDISGPIQGVYDGTTNMRDINYMIIRFNSKPDSSNWNPNADVNNDGTVNMRDIQIAILNFNKHE